MTNSTEIQDKISNRLQFLETKDSKTFWNISREQGLFLREIIQLKKPKNILEVGTSNGYSTLHLVYNAQDVAITTIEVDEFRAKLAKGNFDYCNLNTVTLIQKEAMEYLNSLDDTQFDFIFLDALQKKYKEVIQLLESKNLLSSKATIIADNVLSHNGMDEFIEFMNENYTTQIVGLDDGMLLALRKE